MIYRLTLFVFLMFGGALAIFASVELMLGTISYLRTRAVYADANKRFVSMYAKKAVSENKPVDKGSAVSQNTVSEDEAEEEDPLQTIQVDLKSLREINDEVIGWIYFEDGLISYPILHADDNEKYLKRNYMEKYMASGSIFMDKDGDPDMSDHYTLLYGHNMRDLTMFGKLRYYRSDKNYYKEHEFFQILTEEGVYRYRVFAFKEISADSDVFSVIKADEDGLKAFADKYLIPGSNVNTDTTIKDSDHVLALSTCVNDYAYRFIVCGVRVDFKPASDQGSVSSDSAAGRGTEKSEEDKQKSTKDKTSTDDKDKSKKTEKTSQEPDTNKDEVTDNGEDTPESGTASDNKAVIIDIDPMSPN